jgi:hypothetical protein
MKKTQYSCILYFKKMSGLDKKSNKPDFITNIYVFSRDILVGAEVDKKKCDLD